jgi:hypothetical protein
MQLYEDICERVFDPKPLPRVASFLAITVYYMGLEYSQYISCTTTRTSIKVYITIINVHAYFPDESTV